MISLKQYIFHVKPQKTVKESVLCSVFGNYLSVDNVCKRGSKRQHDHRNIFFM